MAEPLTARQDRPRFRSVADTAAILGMSEVTLYRAIHAGQFPAIKVRGRFVIPARAIDDMEEIALTHGLVDASSYALRPAS
ncbi:helix-turn-helix domain-containing protein [Verrucosispora sioxanthis]|uniref:Helix-turn-helix domain-containing protein n=1 Tax=Verrucosispora sioxanthis TaxID=2499994 RepID=A0A6M1L3S0_9ACTN|nr:helix-turn-helix domain-containing protein [Verrucosispora sioxanthis]NEE64417.1 helix-turn-helix domain-containing protein [Verrucosispora sioxanthis]NGM13527.1 helix-turn-helix domain-containing protein [Verrucosispora sioxanthis]